MSLPAARISAVAGSPSLAARLPLRVLVCEDNHIGQKVATCLLQQLGYRPDLAENGREALERLDAQTYDFIFMDLLMPEMGGLEATRAIRLRQKDPASHPNYRSRITIVTMTACAMQGDREKCLAAGMDDYLSKPMRLDDMRAMIERWGSSSARAAAARARVVGNTSTASGGSAAPATPPVDLERLRELTDGTEGGLGELVALYLEQTTLQMEQLVTAVRHRQADSVRRIAHSCAGASVTCGVRDLVPLLRHLERLGTEANLANAEALCAAATNEVARLRAFLEPHSRPAAELVGQV